MFNLLSYAEQARVRKEYKLRLIVVVLFSLGLILCIALSFLYPSYVISGIREETANRNEDLFKQSVEVRDEEALSMIIANTKAKMTALQLASSELFVHNIIRLAIAKAAEDISLTQFTVKGSETQRELVLNGVARNRTALRGFVKALETVPLFKSVDLPVSDFAKDANSPFSIVIKVAP